MGLDFVHVLFCDHFNGLHATFSLTVALTVSRARCNSFNFCFALFAIPGRNASRDGLVKLGWVHCLQYTVKCFEYDICNLCRCESSKQ